MGLIDSEEAARRLARVIFSDIRLYNREKIQTGADLKSEIEEGYNLYRSRVAPPLFPLFKQVMADSGLRGGRAAPPGQGPPAAFARPPERPIPPERPASPAQGAAPPAERPAPPVQRPAPPSQPVLRPSSPASSPPPALPPRRGRIDSDEAARRLARVIVSDNQIYNPGKAAGDRALASQISDGRNLFRARVSPELAPLFEQILATSGLVDTRRPEAPPAEATFDDFEAMSPTTVRAPAFDDEMTDRHAGPSPIYGDATPVPARPSDQDRRPPEEDFPEAPTLARVVPPATPAPPAQAWQPTWRDLADRLLAPIARIPRPQLVAALAVLAAAVGLIYYFY
jgi:hypothetical protein